MMFWLLMLLPSYHAIIFLVVIVAVIIFFQQRSKGLALLKPICYLAIFQFGGIYFLLAEEDFFWTYIFINLMWTPLAVDDFFNKSVSYWPFLLIVFLSALLFILFGIVTLNVLLSVAILVLTVRIFVYIAEKVIGRQLVGGADYLAAFVFGSSLEIHLVGYWIIFFSLLGILHIISASSLKVAVPLLPFMLASWCLVFSLSN